MATKYRLNQRINQKNNLRKINDPSFIDNVQLTHRYRVAGRMHITFDEKVP